MKEKPIVCCPTCGQKAKCNGTKNGKQRYMCMNNDCPKKTFIADRSIYVTPEMEKKIVSLRGPDKTYYYSIKSLSEQTGISTYYIRKVLKKHGIDGYEKPRKSKEVNTNAKECKPITKKSDDKKPQLTEIKFKWRH